MINDILTRDGYIVHKGDRVFNYYDVEWGTIATDPGTDGWFSFRPDGTDHTKMLNGERISTYQPEFLK